MRRDPLTGNFIGRGEDALVEILKSKTGLPEAEIKKHWPYSGIYRQVPISYLFKSTDMINLDPIHVKSSVDVVIMRASFIVCCRVENKKGSLKMSRQRVQERYLKNNNLLVVDFHELECKELFKDKVNEKSIKEVEDSFKTAGVSIF